MGHRMNLIKGLVETDPEGALTDFAEVVQMEPEKADCRVHVVLQDFFKRDSNFKALKQTLKLYYRLGRYKEMTNAYRDMLTYIKSAVTRNYSEKSVNNIMDFVSGSASQNIALLQEFYQATLKALEEAKNGRLWFKINLKLCNIWFDMGEYGRMNKILKELYKSCQKVDGTDDQKKGTQLLEVYAIEIQIGWLNHRSDGLVETDPEGALTGFAEVVQMEPEKADWFTKLELLCNVIFIRDSNFKALKQTLKLYYRLGRYKEMTNAYREMLTYIKSAVTRNYSEKSVNNIMDFVSGSASQNIGLLQEFYQATLKALEEAKNERLWFKTNLKLCNIWFDMGEYGRMNKILKELYKSCQKVDGTDDQKKGTQLLEVYAIKIQMYTETKNNKKTQEDGSIIGGTVCDEDDQLMHVLFDGVHKCSRCRAYMFSKPCIYVLEAVHI
ncbi:COP9 signalosome complex subunit 2, partial [Tanacetum coccineum]